ncbi:YihY/virulence factor BrkB family protein [Ruegeria pomeroyi]|uniref:Ribonuclease BN, putative n=2 Tax=Ruegeria pomeroyi TaxID=89184 RepID=Q5LSB2_RUEPO|nr:YihY/virulence factor BrkB family protein [Ruegeria pomeroyi]HCE72332.1 YihY/virulence factor BrkB family protein [Ruegeria sp.]AAV95135.1 ribonuclease BN, putative [Ruegeria pomeroyi DSS-3]NVK99346.1 YihY/virulence factor BrkB family protein [Ruegeria pomeroyi]NVL00313.1 YihY/virulence factor BrkB family protein [Ruegeria pomeroyi]QWV08709.1 YihY/virulence factor BrkB family protein [Ruegeria pomeroyi]
MTRSANPSLFLPLRAAWLALMRFQAKSGFVMSSHVAMSMMMALFPFILFTVALAGSLSQDLVTDDLIQLIFGTWPEQVATPIVAELKAVLAGANSRVMTVGGVLAVYFASNGVDAVREAMSRAYHDAETRPFWKTRLLCIAIVVGGGAIVLAVAAFEVVMPIYTRLVTDALPGAAPDWLSVERLSWIFVVAMPAGAVLACHALLPAGRHPLRRILPGVVLTLVLWAGCGWGFSLYIANFASYSTTYAGLAGAMAALIFLYLNAAILILGAEFNGALMDLSGGPD